MDYNRGVVLSKYFKESNDYIIYEDGRIYSLISNKNLRFGVNKDGYCRLNITGNSYLVHQLVWVYFKGPVPRGYEIDHIDNNKLNNSIENLQLLTPKQNNDKMALLNRGSLNKGFKAKMSEEKVRELRKLASEKQVSVAGLAKMFGVCRTTAVRIIKREDWSWVD